MRKLIEFLKYVYKELTTYHPAEIMTVYYDSRYNSIECIDWCGEKINLFTGVLTPELIQNIKPYCRLGNRPQTNIYIWSGMDTKYLAYHEPIDNYLNDFSIWKTGQGFTFHSKIRYGQSSTLKCKCCGRKY